MAGHDFGDFFSDDDLDAATAAALEENAIQFTQHQSAPRHITAPPSSNYGEDDLEEDLDDADVYDEATHTIPGAVRSLQHMTGGEAAQRTQFRQARYTGPPNVNALPKRSLTPQYPTQPHATNDKVEQNARSAYIQPIQDLSSSAAAIGPDVETLQKQIHDLLRQQEALKQDLNIKSGEIAIVRSKQEKATKEYERQLTTIKKLNAERLETLQRTIDSAREAEKHAATELEFAKRDLVEEAAKIKSLKRSKAKESPETDTRATPKKTKSAVPRDGFDDDELQVVSPSKGQGRKSNNGTPTKTGGKRKRKGVESPAMPLDVIEDQLEKKPDANSIVLDEGLLDSLKGSDDRLEFLEALLDHRPAKGHMRAIETFAKFSFTSSTDESFAAMILGSLPKLSLKPSAGDFAIDFCELIISLWSQCLKEAMYKPISLLVDLLTFALGLKTLAVAPFIIDSLLPVAQSTAELVGILRFKRESYSRFEKDIDVSACLELIYLAATGCINDREYTIRFWRLMRLDFVLMMLSQHQPIHDFHMMLQLISMSTMRDSIGPKTMDQDTQHDQAKYIIDRISLLLVTVPSSGDGSQKHDASTILDLRLQILRTFEAFCQTSWGGEVLALHRYAVGRLVKVMSDELDAMYDYQSGYNQSARIVCLAIRILHYLVTKHEKTLKVQEKLSIINGGAQKYLICLARLNFAEENLILEAGIDPEVAECAHELLELAVTPEEGDVIHSAFLAA